MGNSLHCNRSPPKSVTCGNIDVLLHQLPPLLLSRPQPAAPPPALAQTPTAAASRAAPTACGGCSGWGKQQGQCWGSQRGHWCGRTAQPRSALPCAANGHAPALLCCLQACQHVRKAASRCGPAARVFCRSAHRPYLSSAMSARAPPLPPCRLSSSSGIWRASRRTWGAGKGKPQPVS